MQEFERTKEKPYSVSIKWKGESPWRDEERKTNCMLKLLIYDESESSTREIGKEKQIHASLLRETTFIKLLLQHIVILALISY